MRRKKQTKNVLELHEDGRWFENGRWLPKKDYIFRADCIEGSSITSCITDEVYRLNRHDRRVVVYG